MTFPLTFSTSRAGLYSYPVLVLALLFGKPSASPALQPHCAGYTLRIVPFTPAPAVEPSRPKGVGLTALALAALTLNYLLKGLLHLHAGNRVAFEPLLTCLGLALVLLCVWNYWRGQDWARIFVLLWSFAIAAREISTLIDHDDNLISLMSQPVRFFHALLAIFLLYFLNTRPARGWFKKMSATTADLIAEHLVGKLCTAVEKHVVEKHSNGLHDGLGGDLGRDVGEGLAGDPSNVWRLAFEHDAELTLHCPWRIVLDDNLAFASNDSGNPVAADDQQPNPLLQNLRVKAVRIAPRTSDLWVSFEMGIELQSWSPATPAQHPPSQHSQPQWTFTDPTLTVVADSTGVSPKAIIVPAPGEDATEND